MDFVCNVHKYCAAVSGFLYDGLRSELYDFFDFKCSDGNAFRYGITCDIYYDVGIHSGEQNCGRKKFNYLKLVFFHY